MQRRIAVCGAPAIGKTTLLAALAQITGMDRPVFKGGEYENLVWLDIKQPDRRISLLTIAGNFDNTQSKVLPWLLTNVHAVLYISAAIPPNLDQEWYSGACNDEIARQAYFWQMYTTHATTVNSLWTTIPWIFVLNKRDLGDQNPLLPHIPAHFHDSVIPCSATENSGITTLWERIRNL